MKYYFAILAIIFSTGAINAQESYDSENARSIPVKHWEFDYFNYGVSGGQETLYLNFSMALRYNFDTPLVDVGGEFTMGATPHDRYDPLELKKGTTLRSCLNFYHLKFYDGFSSRLFLFSEEDSGAI